MAGIDQVVDALASLSRAQRNFAFAPIATSPRLQWKLLSDPVYLVAKIHFAGRLALVDELLVDGRCPELGRLRDVLLKKGAPLDARATPSQLAAALAVCLEGSDLPDLTREVSTLATLGSRASLVLRSIHHGLPPIPSLLWATTAAGSATSLAVTDDGGRVMVGTADGHVHVLDAKRVTQSMPVSSAAVTEVCFLEETPFGWCRDAAGRAAILRVERPVNVLPVAEGAVCAHEGWTFRLDDRRLTAHAPDGRRLTADAPGFQVKMFGTAPLAGDGLPKGMEIHLESRALVLKERGAARCVLRTAQYSHFAAVSAARRMVARQTDAPLVARGAWFPHRVVVVDESTGAPASVVEVFDGLQLIEDRTVTGNPLLESIATTVRSDGPYFALTNGTVYRLDDTSLVRVAAAESQGRRVNISAIVVRGRQALLLSSHLVLLADLETGRCIPEMMAHARVQDAAFIDDAHYLCTIGSGVESERYTRKISLIELGPSGAAVWEDSDYERSGWTAGDPVRLCVVPSRTRAAVFTDLLALIGYDLLLRKKIWRQDVDTYVSALAAIDDDRIITGHRDGALAVWDVRTGARLAHARPHGSAVAGVALLDGVIVSSGTLGSVHVSTAGLEPMGGLQLPGELSAPVPLSGRRVLIGSGPELRVFDLAGEFR